MLEVRGVSKTFGNFSALRDVNFRIAAGEIVALLGENGAGKSTLLGLLSGNLAPTNGRFFWQDDPLVMHSPRDATARGIGIVHQHFQLVPAFTVAENLALAAPENRISFSQRAWQKRAQAWAESLGWRIDAAQTIDKLSVGERQRVEILKALFAAESTLKSDNGDDHKTRFSAAKLLLLDEPTANLTPREAEELFAVLRRLKAQGCGIVFVSHKLNEVLALCDRVSVLRRGENAGERLIQNTNAEELAQLMVGRALLAPEKAKTKKQDGAGEIVLKIENASCGTLRDFSLSMGRGEIVGLAGVDGNGQAELLAVLSGLRKPDAGSFRFASSSSSLAFIPADRTHVGLIPTFTLFENMALHPALRSECKTLLGLNWKWARARTRGLMEQFDVRAPQSKENATAAQLSGGNQQKLVIARALSFPHQVVIAADPTRGLDVAATQFVHAQLRQAADAGAGVLLVSTDLDEILALSDRIGVLYEGRLLPDKNLLPRGVSREIVGELMGGVLTAGSVAA